MVVCEADKKMLNPDLNTSDNRMASGQGWAYDAAGNVIADPQGRSFIYDAENKQVLVGDQWSVVSTFLIATLTYQRRACGPTASPS